MEVPPPEGLGARTVVLGTDEYLILTLPLPDWAVPGCLTEAERHITLAILRGATNQDMAGERKSSVRTIGNQIARIFAKLGVTSRIELAHRLGAGMSPR
ncbi:MAG: helix-turn-helix domain-containing protein [Polyangiaceae bacterium]